MESLYNTIYFYKNYCEKNNLTSKTRTLIIFSPFCSVKMSVLSRFWIHLSVFPNRFYIKINLIVQAFQLYNCLLTEIIMKRIIWHQRLIIFSPFCSVKKFDKIYLEILKDEFKILTERLFQGTKWRENYQCSHLWCQIILLIINSGER
jgi:hypothetical protein